MSSRLKELIMRLQLAMTMRDVCIEPEKASITSPGLCGLLSTRASSMSFLRLARSRTVELSKGVRWASTSEAKDKYKVVVVGGGELCPF